MPTETAPSQSLQQFRHKLFGVFSRRAAALFESVDARLLTVDPRSAVELSASPAFRRRFSMVYEALREGKVDDDQARQLLAASEPAEARTLGGYAIYAGDSTPHPRPDAPTLADRGNVYSTSADQNVVGQPSSWLGRVVAQGQSWFAPREVERLPTISTPAAVAAQQVGRLAATLAVSTLAVVVVDSAYAKAAFLTALVGLVNLCVLVRLAQNRVLYGAPAPVERHPVTGQRLRRGRPAVHGAKFQLKAPPAPESQVAFDLREMQVRVSAWTGRHCKRVPKLVGMVIRVEFLKPDGSPKYQRPLWLFWSGPTTVALPDRCQMYRLRFGIEPFFRFLKQRLGLLCAQSTDRTAQRNWQWTVVWAYMHLLLARQLVTPPARPWDPKVRRDPQRPLTPGQVRQAWGAFSHGLGTPSHLPRPSGKGVGRAPGACPAPRPRYPVVSKKQPAATV